MKKQHPVKRRFLWLIDHTLNRATTRLARTGHGPFSLVRHVGRKTGTIYETPIIVARDADGFIAELTYGPEVSWYRNIVAAGGCVIVFKGADYRVDRIEPCSVERGLDAFGNPRKQILKLLRRRDFRLLHQAEPADGRSTES
jgi:deazaflavin-dependent oxidoreductase (nitroreductase family)